MAVDTRLTFPEGTGPVLKRYQVVRSFASVRAVPDERTSQTTELLHGQFFDVHETNENWALGRAIPLLPDSQRLGYVGWVRTDCLEEMSITLPTHAVTSLSAPIFMQADLKSPIVGSLPIGSRIHVQNILSDYAKISEGQFVNLRHVRNVSERTSDLIEATRAYLGQPYVWGGTGARGVDCSGLVQMALAACGIDSPRDADQQEAALGMEVAAPEEAGDLLFWPGHVGLLSAPGVLLHANAYHMKTVEEPLQEALDRMARAGVTLRRVKRL